MLNGWLIFILACLLKIQYALSLWGCTQDAECSALDGSVCVNGECRCPAPTQPVLMGTHCAQPAPYHTSPCFDDFQCSRLFTDFECRRDANATSAQAGQCGCREGHYYFHGRCWPSLDFGEPCSRDEECFNVLRDPFSMSCSNGVCDCSEGYYLRQRGECRRSALAEGDACVIDEDCRFDGGRCQFGIFTCVSESSSATESLEAEPSTLISTTSNLTRQHGVICDAINECQPPFQCSSLGVCVCPVGYYPNAGGSICLAEMGSPVTSPDQCVGFFTEVRDGICTCRVNFYFDEAMRGCVRATARPGDSCIIDAHCHTFGAFSRCGPPGLWDLRTCECIPGQTVWNANRMLCALFGGIGEQCEQDSDCIAGDMEIQCLQTDEGYGVCSCPEGYQAVGELCLMLGQELGQECQVDQECATQHAVCSDRTCECGVRYQQVDDYCAPVIGGTCETDDNCIVANTICDSAHNTCQCGEGLVTFEDSCWPVVTEYGGGCNISLQCSSLGEAASCDDGVCMCGKDQHFRDGVCWPRTGLFESCSRSSQCYFEAGVDVLECRNSLCQCSFYHPYHPETGTCRISSNAFNILANYKILLLALLYIYFS